MINFYSYYNRTGLDKEEYAPAIHALLNRGDVSIVSPIIHIIKKHPHYAFHYTKNAPIGRWHEAEPYIMKKPRYAYRYASEIIQGRWSEAETYIMTDPWYTYAYASAVIHGRWLEAESCIMKDPHAARYYAVFILHGRWMEAEPYIQTNEFWWETYCEDFKI